MKLWVISYARWKVIHKGVYQSPLSTNYFLNRFIEELDLTKPAPQQAMAKKTTPRWIRPPPGCMKINVDAATSKNSPRVAIAAIARNPEGVFLGASAVVIEGIIEAETAEALACREAIALEHDLLLRRIRIASDCLSLIKNLQGRGMSCYGQVT